MKQLTWLHLSDWHQKGPDFDRGVVRDALITDIRERERIEPALAQVDFVVFSGDLAFSGKPAEYEAARHHLLDPLLDAVGLEPSRLFIVPGNHDLSRETVYDMLPTELQRPLDSDALVQKWLDAQKRARTLEPFDAYREFVSKYTGQPTPDYASILRLDVSGKQVALLGLNSAWMSARNRDAQGEVNDYGYTLIGEPQLHNALAQIADAELRIAVVHHPFDWLNEFDRNRTEPRLGRECHFILRGHVHNPQVHVLRGTTGDCVIIPAGACYERRVAQNPRYTNAYNWVHLDFEAGTGAVYLRRWSDQRNEWIEDIDSHPGGKFVFEDLPKQLGKKRPDTNAPSEGRLTLSPPPRFERERIVLEGYLNALLRDNTDLDSGGVKQTKVQVVVPLDEIYVGLQADRDRPDVDRRVMQEDLDEIKKNLEREEDPKEREKQYQIWAQHSRVIQEALELSGPREDLANIVQRHRQVVVLGEPGSGKTTLVRYLTLRLARAIQAEPERLFQPQKLWDEKEVWQLPSIGPVRLPILLRISHYAEARQKDPDLALLDYLPRYFAGLSVPHADDLGLLFQRLLDEGRCILLLDGLDEIIEPADRRNIAAAIGQFAGVYRETGLPDWLAHSLAFAPTRAKENLEANTESVDEGVDISIQWDKNVPEDVLREWVKLIKQRREGWRHRGRAVRLAWELLDEARYTHVGNRFVVTSRIAGYHFAGVPGEFEHYTIRRMSLDDIKMFLEKWCPAVERRIAAAPDPAQVDQRARREIEGILQAVETTPGVRRMAENPLLLRILAIIHRNEAHLPQRRVELYETATITLLRDWNLERGLKAATIDDVRATSLLGPVAFYIHENRATGFLSKGETERILANILSRERGEKDPENPSLETREAVHHFLETVREHSGLFVERGEGLYGFMHLTFEEYFTARQLVSSSTRARAQILERLHLPRWREPILLAVGSLSKQFYDDTQDLLRAILDAGSAYERVLHRDLLFAAACVGDSVNVAPVLRQEVAGQLLALYCDRRRAGRFRLLQQQVKGALLTLCNDQGDAAVEAALAEMLACCADRTALTCALDAVNWLMARTLPVARALAACCDTGVLPRAQDLLRAVQARLAANGNGTRSAPVGWDAVRYDPSLAQLLAAILRYGWRATFFSSLGIPKDTLEKANLEVRSVDLVRAIGLANSLLQCFSGAPPVDQRDAGSWNAIAKALKAIWTTAPADSEMEAATLLLMQAVVGSLKNRVDTQETLRDLKSFLRRNSGLEQDETEAPGTLALDQALVQFQNLVHVEAGKVKSLDVDQVLQSAGSLLLKAASAGHTLAGTFAAAAGRFASLRLLPDGNTLRADVQTLQTEIQRTLLDLLRLPANGQQYQEAALSLSLAATGSVSRPDSESEEARLRAEAAVIVCTDLESVDTTRRRWALQALASPAVCEHVQLTDARRATVAGLLDGPADQATQALEILFNLGFNPDLLAACWSVLLRPNHPLAPAVGEKLEAVKEVNGDRQTLALLDEGLRKSALRLSAQELLRKVKWHGVETLAQALTWLTSEDAEVRHLAALLLAGQEDLAATLRSALGRAAQQLLGAAGVWTALREDARLVRLLGGLWLHGWDDALTQLWVAQLAKPYVDKHPRKYWKDFRTYPESEDCVRWLLEKAELGQSLIPSFQDAATRLAELEGDYAHSAPLAEHIVAVQQEMIRPIDALLTQPATSPLLRAEATILAAAIRKEAIPPILAESVQIALEGANTHEWFAVLSWLAAQKEQKPFAPYVRLLCSVDNPHPFSAWMRQTLAMHDLAPNSPPAALAHLLAADAADTRAAASVALLAADMLAPLVAVLLECVQLPDDRIRMKAEQRLRRVCVNLPTDGSTSAVETLLLFHQDAEACKDGHLGTVSIAVMGSVRHEQPFWIARWLETLGKDEPSHKLALTGLGVVHNVSADVLSNICAVLNDPDRALADRRAVAGMLGEILKNDGARRADAAVLTALTTNMGDPDTTIRRRAAYALQWAAGQGSWPVTHALLRAAQTDPDAQTSTLALRSLGCVLHAVRGFRDVDVSKEALLRWLETQTKERSRYERTETADAVKQLSNLLAIEEAPDAEAVLAALSHPDTLGLPEDAAARLRGSETWDTLAKHAQQEWETRRYWLQTLPLLPAAIAQMEEFLSASNPDIRRAAACALARLYHGDDDRPARLRDLLPDDPTLLRALLDAATDQDAWNDEGESRVSHHPWAVKQIVGWVEAKPPEQHARLIDSILADLDQAMAGMGGQKEEDDLFIDRYGGWPTRRILTTVLAELSERLTYRAFTHTRDLANIVALFIRAATDPGSYSTRRFAIRALGNLQQLTHQVADVFFAACQDVGTVYRETRTAVTRFKAFGTGSLEWLTAAIRSPSITVAYHAALLLGELGLSRSEDLGREGRQRVADELVQLLDDPLAERIVYDFSKDSDGTRVGPLYDVVYEALVRVVAGPDAPASATALEQQ